MRCFSRSWLLFGVVACALLTAGAYWLTRPRLSITKETCAKIRPGMMRAEVEVLIGGPPGVYTTDWVASDRGSLLFWAALDTWWINNWGEIGVKFDPKGRMQEACFFPVYSMEPSGFLARLRFRLGW